jgi:formylmethanofuran dehydrogenase subunit B
LKHRADVVVFWGVDPTKRYPRFIERFVSGSPAFAKQRKTIAIDVGEAMGPNGCVERLAVPPDREVDALTAARAVVRDRHMLAQGESLSNVTELTSRLLAEARYVAIVFDAEPDSTPRDPDLPEALIAFSQALNTRLRAALFGLRAGGNRNGFESLLTWQTGYPFSVSFASGAPRYESDETTSERLARGRYDAVLVVGSTNALPLSIVGELRKRPTVIIGPRASETAFAAEVAIDTGVPGIHDDGLVLRMDDVPFEVQGMLSHPHRMEDLLLDLTRRITTLVSGQ